MQVSFEVVVARQGDGLATLLAQVHPQPLVLDVDVLDPHGGGRPDPGEGVNHQPDQCPVAQACMATPVDAVEICRASSGVVAPGVV